MKKINYGKLSNYIDESLRMTCEFLSAEFDKEFEVKGKTILQNKGSIYNQMLHTDGKVECICDL